VEFEQLEVNLRIFIINVIVDLRTTAIIMINRV